MITEDFEFLISQFADGTLAADEHEAARVRIESDPAARSLLADFRRIDRMLVSTSAVPSVNFDLLQGQISDAVDDESTDSLPAVAGRIGPAVLPASVPAIVPMFRSWKIWTALAACVLIAVGIGNFNRPHTSPIAKVTPTPAGPVAQPPGDIVVVGPAVEPPAGPAIEQITIGPSPALASRGSALRYADDVMSRPSTVKIADRGAPLPKSH